MQTKQLLKDLKFAKKHYKRALKYKKLKTFKKNNLDSGLCYFFRQNYKLSTFSLFYKTSGFFFSTILVKLHFIEKDIKILIETCILPRYKFLCAAIKEVEEMIDKGIEYTEISKFKLIVNEILDKSKL